MIMHSRYPGKCKACGRRFKVGTLISWTKLDGAYHAVCPNRKAANYTPNPAPYGVTDAEAGRGVANLRADYDAAGFDDPLDGDGFDSADRAEIDMARKERERDDFEYAIGYSHGLDCNCRMCADMDARTY